MRDLTLREIKEIGYNNLTPEQVRGLWYDWFCRDTSLVNKGYSLLRKLNQIIDSKKLNLDTMYVFFKNNCPCVGNLYDDFRICDIATGKVIYTIVPRSGFKKDNGEAQLYGRENDFDGPIVAGTWKDIKKYFMEDK